MAVNGYKPPKEAVDRQCRLLPSVLDHVARVSPDRVYAAAPVTSNLDDGLRDVTFDEISRATAAFSRFLANSIGTSDKFDTLTYVGVDDLRYAIFLFACIKTGHKALFVSPRNTAEQNAHLVATTKCRHLFHSREHEALAGRVVGLSPALKARTMEPLDHWLASYDAPYPFCKTFEEAKYDPIVVLHSSGSTGPPKAITQNHLFFTNYTKKCSQVDGRPGLGFSPFDHENGGFFFSPFPFCHLGGVLSVCIYTVFSPSMAMLMRLPDRPATAEMALRLLRMRKVRVFHSPPSIIEDLWRIEEGFERLKRLDLVTYAGGPLMKSCGDALSKSVIVCSSYGSTETGNVLIYRPAPDDWQYLEFHPTVKVSLEEEEHDGTFELVLYQDEEADKVRPIGATILRHEPYFRTRDLFVRHAEKPHLWRFCKSCSLGWAKVGIAASHALSHLPSFPLTLLDGRKDDIIVFSNGQKWNPVPSEAHIMSETKAAGALIAGANRTEPALLIEMHVESGQFFSCLDKVWPAVEQANLQTQRYGRISRSRIAFVEPGTFTRTPKGTIVRRTSLTQLQATVDRLYEDDMVATNGSTNGHGEDAGLLEPLPADISNIVRKCVFQVQTVCGVDDDEEFFVRGLDSLEAAEIARSLKTELRPYARLSALEFLGSHIVFENATISWLTQAVTARLTGAGSVQRKSDITFTELLTKYKAKLSDVDSRAISSPRSLGKVAISGTTGSLGGEILELLLKDDCVSSVFCLNRNSTAQKSFEVKAKSLKKTVNFLKVDFTEADLGLADADLRALEDVDAIVHCAWEVNFNRALGSFEPQISALTDLAKICLRGTKQSRLYFVSSTSAAAENSPEVLREERVPETLITEPMDTPRMGYAASKNAAEHLLAYASEHYGLPTTVLRVGQIAGPMGAESSTLHWNRKEWLPSMIDTSASLRKVPGDLPPVDWVPVDACARVILDLAGHDIAHSKFSLYNVVNPHSAPWKPLAESIKTCLGGSAPCKLVSFQDWVESLRQHDDGEPESLKRYPGLKLLPYYESSAGHKGEEGRIPVATALACAASPTLAALAPIDGAHMKRWMTQWGYPGEA